MNMERSASICYGNRDFWGVKYGWKINMFSLYHICVKCFRKDLICSVCKEVLYKSVNINVDILIIHNWPFWFCVFFRQHSYLTAPVKFSLLPPGYQQYESCCGEFLRNEVCIIFFSCKCLLRPSGVIAVKSAIYLPLFQLGEG